MHSNTIYDYIIIGAGIAGSNVAFFLHQHTSNILLVDSEDDVAQKASGAAGAFLSPLLGKPNKFKDLVNEALVFSTQFYKEHIPQYINNCSTTRIPKNKIDNDKFKSYENYMDFQYTIDNKGYNFPIGSVVDSYNICKTLTKDVNKKLRYQVKNITFKNDLWYINDELITKNLILTTGAKTNLIDEFYFQIRPIWGQRIDISTTTCTKHNYHKECSVSVSTKLSKELYKISIGATHERNVLEKKTNNTDTEILLKKASDILDIQNINILKKYGGARAASVDYFPIVGTVINAQKTIKEFPYLTKGTYVPSHRFTRYKKLFLLNGLGGRGFVLAPYLAYHLSQFLFNNTKLPDTITIDRLFKREVKRLHF